jgi:hypothetical protein
MRVKLILAAAGSAATLALAGLALAQSEVEMRTGRGQAPHFEIVPPGPASREATRPSDADFYREDVRVRHDPAFIEPFAGKTKGGNDVGVSGWTAPATPVGSLASQGYQQTNGWFALGITFVFDYPPKAATRPRSAPR